MAEENNKDIEINIEDGDIEEEIKEEEKKEQNSRDKEKKEQKPKSEAASEETEKEKKEAEAGEEKKAAPEEKKEKTSEEKFFKKKKKKDPKDEKIEELTDKVQRQLAEFDNFRKRTEKEKAQMFDVGARSIIEKILPVVDNFERGLEAISDEEKENPIAEGMEKIYKQLITTLKEAGVEPIEAEGKEFDPNFHNAVMHIEDENLGENIVAKEFQKGYTYHDTVVRHSMVQVAN